MDPTALYATKEGESLFIAHNLASNARSKHGVPKVVIVSGSNGPERKIDRTMLLSKDPSMLCRSFVTSFLSVYWELECLDQKTGQNCQIVTRPNQDTLGTATQVSPFWLRRRLRFCLVHETTIQLTRTIVN